MWGPGREGLAAPAAEAGGWLGPLQVERGQPDPSTFLPVGTVLRGREMG